MALQLVAPLTEGAGSGSFSRQNRPNGAPNDPPTRYRIAQDNLRWWLQDPIGTRFWSLGVNCVQQGTPRSAYDPENPSYAAWRLFASPELWADSVQTRLHTWGFTTLGAWCDDAFLADKSTTPSKPGAPNPSPKGFYQTPVLHLGATVGAPWWDLWDPGNLNQMEAVARERIGAYRDHPGVVGYYSDNELGWWNAALWKSTLEQPPSSGQRRELIRLLRSTYQNDWSRLLLDFETERGSHWRQLSRRGMLYLRPGGNGIRVMRQFLGLLADRYYGLMRGYIRQFDPRALYLGDRYQSFYYPEVALASGKHVDVASVNLNAQFQDGTFLRCFLPTLHDLTQKPILVSEFYVAAMENRSGNRNSSAGFLVVPTQRERAESARRTLLGLARTPFVVGADWFQFNDEPTHGRDDGENFNFGLVDLEDRPYEELTRMFAEARPVAEHARELPPYSDASGGIPPAPAQPFDRFRPPTALQSWDRERGYVPPATPQATADLYAAWSSGSLLLRLYSLDIVESAYYSGPWVPKADRPLLSVRVDGREVAAIRLGAGREPLIAESRIRVENSSGLGNHVANVAAIEIPADLLSRRRLQAGDRLHLEVTLQTHARAYRMEWRGDYTLRP